MLLTCIIKINYSNYGKFYTYNYDFLFCFTLARNKDLNNNNCNIINFITCIIIYSRRGKGTGHTT